MAARSDQRSAHHPGPHHPYALPWPISSFTRLLDAYWMTARVIPTIDGPARSQRHPSQDERSDVQPAYSRDDPCGHPALKQLLSQDERSDVQPAYSRDDPCGHPAGECGHPAGECGHPAGECGHPAGEWRSSCGGVAVILRGSAVIRGAATRVPGVNYASLLQSCY